MKKISTGTETLRVFRAERDAATASATKTTEEAEEAVVQVLPEMVSPSQETNLTFPWFIAMHPGCGRVYFVERSSNKSQ